MLEMKILFEFGLGLGLILFDSVCFSFAWRYKDCYIFHSQIYA